MRAIRKLAFTVMLVMIGIKGITTHLQAYQEESALEAQIEEIAVKAEPVSQPAKEPEFTEEEKISLPETIAAMNIDFDALAEINEDVVAWIYIPAIDLSYPVVQGEDNNEYLHKSFDGSKNNAGSVFMNKSNNKNFSDENTFIFAHNMKNGSMFGALKSFVWNKETIDSDSYIWIFTPDMIYQYEIFAAYNTDNKSDMYEVTKDHAGYVERALKQSVIEHESNTAGKLLTLSTCAGVAGSGKRLLVHASLIQTY